MCEFDAAISSAVASDAAPPMLAPATGPLEMSRYHLAIEAIRRMPRLNDRAPDPIAECRQELADALACAHDHLEDAPAISRWVWPTA